MARSNSAKLPTICIIIRPAGVVVSMFSVSDRKPAPAWAMRSMMCSTSFSERDSATAGRASRRRRYPPLADDRAVDAAPVDPTVLRTLKSDGLKLEETQMQDAGRLFKLALIGLAAGDPHQSTRRCA